MLFSISYKAVAQPLHKFGDFVEYYTGNNSLQAIIIVPHKLRHLGIGRIVENSQIDSFLRFSNFQVPTAVRLSFTFSFTQLPLWYTGRCWITSAHRLRAISGCNALLRHQARIYVNQCFSQLTLWCLVTIVHRSTAMIMLLWPFLVAIHYCFTRLVHFALINSLLHQWKCVIIHIQNVVAYKFKRYLMLLR